MDLELKTVLDNIRGSVGSFDTRVSAMQTQLDAVDKSLKERSVAGLENKGLTQFLGEHDGIQRLLRDRKGSAVLTLTAKDIPEMFTKTTITSAAVGASTSGVLAIERIPGIVPEARQALTVRSVLTANPTTMQIIDFVKVNSPMVIASPVAEGNVKPENSVTFAAQSERVKTIATWLPASRQILDDLSELASFIGGSLSYYVNLEEELQLLSGDGTSENLHGILPQAATFNTGLLHPTAGWNKIDIIGNAIEQLAIAKELAPTFAVVNPADWWGGMRLLKDSFGRYILGAPGADVQPMLFGLTVVPTNSIAAGTFLVGSGNLAAIEIRDRMELVVEVSSEHSDFWTRNLLAVRAEKRLALLTKRPSSFITGSFSTSPA